MEWQCLAGMYLLVLGPLALVVLLDAQRIRGEQVRRVGRSTISPGASAVLVLLCGLVGAAVYIWERGRALAATDDEVIAETERVAAPDDFAGW